MPTIKKAVIAVAGAGTRFLAATKTMWRGGIFLAKAVENGEWLTTGDPLNCLKAATSRSLPGSQERFGESNGRAH